MSTLAKINEAEVISSDGFKVKLGHHLLSYLEGTKVIQIELERLASPNGIVLYLGSTLHWLFKGQPAEELSSIECEIVIARIKDCLEFLNYRYSIE